jgi:hypothetical protein
LGGAWAALALAALRVLLHLIEFRNLHIGQERVKNLLITGSPEESARVQHLLSKAGVVVNLIGTVAPSEGERLPALVRIFQADEIIFCSRDISVRGILDWMTCLGPRISYKIVPEGSQSIIGSSSKDAPGELYTTDTRYNIAQPGQRRNKRVFDLGLCLLLLVTLPLWVFFAKSKKVLLQNWLPVLAGRKHWVGYASAPGNDTLPRLAPGVFSPTSGWGNLSLSGEMTERLNFLYAKDWNVWKDAGVVWRVV